MTHRLRLFAVSGLLGLAAVTMSAAPTEKVVSAAPVTSGQCTADVTPTTGVSVSVANDGDCVIKFTSPIAVTWTRPAGVTSVELFAVGGGGGGGAHLGGDPGGGGGGGIVHVPTYAIAEPEYYVQVGIGGEGNYGWCGQNALASGQDGGSSVFGIPDAQLLLIAYGGGGGGGACTISRDGGSGGGAHYGGLPTTATKGSVDAGMTGALLYGNAGGGSFNAPSPNQGKGGGGGGGGATTAGQNGTSTKAGDGGEGLSIDALGTGTPVVYGSGGGGAGGTLSITPGTGGTNGGNGKQGDGVVPSDVHAVDGTGSGGGGSLCPTTRPCVAGRGGDGVVIIRYAVPGPAPTNSSVPVLSGTAQVGSTLLTTNGTWTGSPTSYTYEWQRSASANGTFAAISGATASSYVVTSSDVGQYIRVTVRAQNASGPATASSSAIGPVTEVAAQTETTTTTSTTTTVAPQPVAATATPTRTRTNRVMRPPATPTQAPTATTVPVTTPPTTTPVAVAPQEPTAPEVKPGEAMLVIDGEESSMIVSRRDNQLIVTNGNFTSTISAVSPNGERRPLDADGNIRIEEGD